MARWLLLCALVLVAFVLGYRAVTRASDAQPLGGVCDSTYECQVGTRCVAMDGVIDGQCSATCNSDASCSDLFGAAAMCLGADVCARTCESAADCPSGTACNRYGWCERQWAP
jgi:hypothetical protein